MECLKMKKTVLLGTLLAISGCAAQTAEIPETYQVVYPETVSVPCSYACLDNNCPQAAAEPLVLKPRVTEVVSTHKKRRCCPDDVLETTEQQQTIIPELPEIYVISANRTVNTMLNDAKAVFGDKPVKVYIAETQMAAEDLPKGADKGVKSMKKRLNNVSTVILTDKLKDAEYKITTSADWFDTPTKQVPAIKYTLELSGTDGVKIGEWTEVIHQTDGDRSWW